ncbi:MFS transporter [Ideonella sp. A 288]|uniref:MFS transporter n=1 Tax=Ideonella sp. A 288 TaxID=1962181 RepID=UPI001F461740|nr:MFS transporter [Ideonella sp. A 288]
MSGGVDPAAEPDRGPPLLRDRGFRRFWLSRWASTTAGQMMMVALGWQMYDLTGSAWDLGLVGLAQFVPALLLALPAGHLVDRHDRRRVLLLALAMQCAVALVLAWASHRQVLGREGVLALSMVLGAVRAFQMPASQALLPQLVPMAALPRALALSSGAIQGSIITGPAIGGLVYAAGPQAVHALSAAGFVAALAWTAGLRPREVVASREPASMRTLLAGLAFIRQRPVVLGAISLDLFAVLLGGATALLPIFARDILHAGPAALGLLRSSPAVGALAMSVVLARWPVQRRSGRWLLGSVAAFGVATIVFGLSRELWLSMLALSLSGAADMVSVVIRQTLVQLETPDAMRGRVSAVNSIFIGASNQLGEFESGAMAAWLGAVGSVVSGGIGTLVVVGVWTRLFPALAARDRLVAESVATPPGASR